MASKSSALQAFNWADESSFGEAVSTFDQRSLTTAMVDTSGIVHPSQSPEFIRQRPNEGFQDIRMPYTPSFSTEMYLTGMGSTCSGAVPSSQLVTLLGHVLGASADGLATGDTATGGTATVPTTTGASGAAAGALVRVGDKGDSRADGQWAAVATHAGNDLTLLTALPDAPSNGDVVYASRLVYPSSTPGTFEAIQTIRAQIQSTLQQYNVHGVYPTGIEFPGLNPGELPKVSVAWGGARIATDNDTFPTTTAADDHSATPAAGGSFFWNAVGTATRNTLLIRSFSLTHEMTTGVEMAPEGLDDFQAVLGCNRQPGRWMAEFVVDSEAAGTDTFGDIFDTDENSRGFYHFLYSLSVADGRSLAIYAPRVKIIDQKPVQSDVDGVLRKMVRVECCTGATTTNDLTMSPVRLGFA
jgi:hypothetical protein